MRLSLKTQLAALLLSQALFVPPPPLHAQGGPSPPQTRPRRVTPPADVTTPAEATTPAPPAQAAWVPDPKGEPLVRVGLSTDARSVNVSTTGRLLVSVEPVGPAPLEVARVRVEPRSLAPPASPDAAGPGPSAELAEATEDSSTSISPPPSSTGPTSPINPTVRTTARTQPDASWSAPARQPPAAAQASRERGPQSAGAPGERKREGGVRLASRVSPAVRGAVVYQPWSAAPLFDARGPLVFASDDEPQHPVKFNEKAYRGRLEVFPNRRGTLTVVNVVSLEDYVRGVVPNELSPGGWPELEALKAQAVAARTYAVSNRNHFAAEGFDLLPTTRSQVYGGRSTEHPLTDRAVFETRGRVLTYQGRPANALYTSTCGGRTEDAENIFGGQPVPYLRGRACSVEGHDAFEPLTVRTSRDLPSIIRAEHAMSARDAALLATHGFALPARLTDEWLAAALTFDETRALVEGVARLARQPAPALSDDATRPGGFATALALALDGESRADTLLSPADVQYLLAFRDAGDVPERNRADVALMLRSGDLALFPDATLRPRQPLARARALRTVAHALEARQLFRLHKATARPARDGSLVLRPATGKGADRKLNVSASVHLFRLFGESPHAVREVALVGGEAVVFHSDARGEVDYLEVSPAASGAAADRFSPFSVWEVTLTPGEAMSRLARSVGDVGALVDLRVRARGTSRRVLDLEVEGTRATAHVRGGRVRTALGLREQLFVIERRQDESGRVHSFTFRGRGWGHGVGMCQVGAYGLARAGLNYQKILKSFYTGVELTKLY